MPPTPISVWISKGPSRVPRSRATGSVYRARIADGRNANLQSPISNLQSAISNQQSAISNQQCMVVPMGVLLTPIIVKQPLTLEELRGRTLAIDGHGELYQFLALIRLRD